MKAWDGNNFPGGDGIVYYPLAGGRVPSSGDDRNVGYQLVDIFTADGLWAHRDYQGRSPPGRPARHRLGQTGQHRLHRGRVLQPDVSKRLSATGQSDTWAAPGSWRAGPVRADGPDAVGGVDLNAAMIDLARALAAGIEWHIADAITLPLPDAGFEVVCCQQGLQFSPDPAGRARRDAPDVPGGRLVLPIWRAIVHDQPGVGRHHPEV